MIQNIDKDIWDIREQLKQEMSRSRELDQRVAAFKRNYDFDRNLSPSDLLDRIREDLPRKRATSLKIEENIQSSNHFKSNRKARWDMSLTKQAREKADAAYTFDKSRIDSHKNTIKIYEQRIKDSKEMLLIKDRMAKMVPKLENLKEQAKLVIHDFDLPEVCNDLSGSAVTANMRSELIEAQYTLQSSNVIMDEAIATINKYLKDHGQAISGE